MRSRRKYLPKGVRRSATRAEVYHALLWREAGEDLLEARQAAEGVEVGVVLQPGAEALAGAHRPVEQVEGLVRVAGARVTASGVERAAKSCGLSATAWSS